MRLWGRVRKKRAAWPPLLLALLLLAGLLGACGSASAGPQSTVGSFLAGWAARDWPSMRHFVTSPPAAFASINAAALSDLGVTKASYQAGSPVVSGTAARVPVTERLTIPGFGVWRVRTTLHLVERSGRWLVEWSPETIDPSLRSGSHFALTTNWPPRAPILGAGGVPLTTEDETVNVGIEGNYVKDPSSLSAALVSAGATSAEVSSALTAAKTNPTYFEPVFTVSWARYLQLKPTLYLLPGTVFQTAEAREAVTPGLEAHLVGSVGPITAEELHALGSPYDATSIVGQTGLEQIDQAQLAGSPGVTISVVRDDGVTRETLASRKPEPGMAVRTSIDPVIQRAAEAALARERKPAALVAVDAYTGQVLASVSDPSSDAFDQAVDGSFPPGSTFKTITSTALIEHGLSPSSSASCPTTITVGGELFHNAEGDAPAKNMAQAFTESCNTAFIDLASKNLRPANLAAAAAQYDVGKSPDMGLQVFGGSVPTPTSAADLAASSDRPGSRPRLAARHGDGRRGDRLGRGARAAPRARRAGRSGADPPATGRRGRGSSRNDGGRRGEWDRCEPRAPAWDLREDRDRRVRGRQPATDRRVADRLPRESRVRGPRRRRRIRRSDGRTHRRILPRRGRCIRLGRSTGSGTAVDQPVVSRRRCGSPHE